MARYIDADVLSKAVIQSKNDNRHSDWILRQSHANEHRHFFSMIEAAPTADVAPIRRGRWKYVGPRHTELPADCIVECTSCGSWLSRYRGMRYNYCPFCGAKMEEVEG